MTFKERYERTKQELLNDKSINKENRDLFKKFFDIEEEKLKRINDNAHIDEASYKTLCGYINKFYNVNSWFKNKTWSELTLKEIEQVYKDLEDGKILNSHNKRFEDRAGYYNKVFRSLPFKLAGKTKEVEETLRFYTNRRKKPVVFVNEPSFKKLVSVVSRPDQLALMWLSWDIGENINSLLQLKASNFQKQINKETNEVEYKVWLDQSRLKRSRQQRSEVTLFPETAKYLDIVLNGLAPNEEVFRFEYRMALKFFKSAVKKSKIVCEPNGEEPSWKDLRSGMACNLFANYGWTKDDINLRLGHTITSSELESYFSYLAGNSKSVKKLHYQNNLQKVQEELEQLKLREKTTLMRMNNLEDSNKELIRMTSEMNETFMNLYSPLLKKVSKK
jgi:hypothetical protein